MQSGTFAAAVLGASGNVGGSVVKALLAEPRCTSVLLLNRRTLDVYNDQPRVKQHVIDMDKVETEASSLLKDAGVSACFVTMGVGQPSKANAEQLKKVDVEIPTSFAKAAKTSNSVRHISLLTSVGADVNKKPSRFTGTIAGGGLYMSLKGQVEQNFKEAGLQSTAIFRPSTLVGNANTPSWVPYASAMISWAVPLKYKEIHIDDLGKAMVKAAVKALDAKGPTAAIYEGADLFDLTK